MGCVCVSQVEDALSRKMHCVVAVPAGGGRQQEV